MSGCCRCLYNATTIGAWFYSFTNSPRSSYDKSGYWRQTQPGQATPPPTDADNLSAAQREMVLYPNPTTDLVHIAPAEAGRRYEWVRVLDRYGLPVRELRTTGDENLQQVSLADLPAGLYAVQLFDGERIVTRHLVKE